MEQRLTLLGAAFQITEAAVLLHLGHVPGDRLPTLDLALVVIAAAAAVVAAIPLEPATRVLIMDPALPTPHRERLRSVHPEEVQFPIAARIITFIEFRGGEPAFGKFRGAIGHVPATEHAHLKHFTRRKLRLEVRMKVAAGRFAEAVAVALLHGVVHRDDLAFGHALMGKLLKRPIGNARASSWSGHC